MDYKLTLPSFEHKVEERDGKYFIFDIIRKKQVVLTPEEWVRQHFVHLLTDHYKYPKSMIKLEGGLKYNSLSNRSDIVVYNQQGEPWMLVECKSADIDITQKVFDQAARYNHVLKAKFLVVTNGIKHFICEIDHVGSKFTFLNNLPSFR